MPQQPPRRGEGWTVESVRLHLQQQIDALRAYHDSSLRALERSIESNIAAADKAIAKSEASVDRRLEALNEFRGVLSDQQRTLVSRDEYMAAHANLVERVTTLQDRLNRAEGRGAGLNSLWLIIVAGISTVGVIITTVVLITEHM